MLKGTQKGVFVQIILFPCELAVGGASIIDSGPFLSALPVELEKQKTKLVSMRNSLNGQRKF